jgi:hypothetical protein
MSDTSEPTVTKVDPATAGCWIDGHLGQYAVPRMIEIAADHGYRDPATDPPFAQPDIVDIARRKLASMGPSTSPQISDDEEEQLMWTVDDVESWMNENIAPEGYSFGWLDGEFFLGSASWWEEE